VRCVCVCVCGWGVEILLGYSDTYIQSERCVAALMFDLPQYRCSRSRTVILKVCCRRSESGIAVCWQFWTSEAQRLPLGTPLVSLFLDFFSLPGTIWCRVRIFRVWKIKASSTAFPLWVLMGEREKKKKKKLHLTTQKQEVQLGDGDVGDGFKRMQLWHGFAESWTKCAYPKGLCSERGSWIRARRQA